MSYFNFHDSFICRQLLTVQTTTKNTESLIKKIKKKVKTGWRIWQKLFSSRFQRYLS